jgi:branched-chain amino acid transport system permease protein
LRATAIDPYAAGISGVNIDRTSMATWALAGMLSGATAILIAPLVAFHVFFMTALLLRGIAAALVGGMTSIAGAVAAGITIGVAEGVIAYTTPIAGIVEASLSMFMIALLIIRPAGLVRSSY